MNLLYCKRFRMEADLRRLLPPATLPNGFFFVPFDDNILELHAQVHYHAFCDELDSALFPSFGDPNACIYLMREIRRQPGFCPQATWLTACEHGLCGAIQAVLDRHGTAAIQNVGVLPCYRGLGLGSALMLQSLHGLRTAGAVSVYLEVTAENSLAIRLYHRLGFRKMKTLYKSME